MTKKQEQQQQKQKNTNHTKKLPQKTTKNKKPNRSRAVRCPWIKVFKEPQQSLLCKENSEVAYTFVLSLAVQYNVIAWYIQIKDNTKCLY